MPRLNAASASLRCLTARLPPVRLDPISPAPPGHAAAISRRLAAFCLLAASWLAAPAGAQDISRLSMTIDGKPTTVVTYLYKPSGNGPFPVVVFLHGRPPPNRMNDPFPPLTREHGKFWTDRGVAVVAPVRPGYSPTGGDDGELAFTTVEVDGKRETRQTFATSTANGTRVVLSALDWVRQQPWARKDRLLIEGQSMGGLLAVTTAGRNPEGVLGAVSFAGGVGGNPARAGKAREPEMLTPIFADAGAATRLPMLWVNAPNDSYFGPEVVSMWFTAYKAGGSDAIHLQTPPTPGEGHDVIRSSPEFWTTNLDAFIAKIGLLAP